MGGEGYIVEFTKDYDVPKDVKDADFKYVLGKEDLENILPFIQNKMASSRTVAEFIIHYAITDCTPAWLDDIPNKQ